MAVNLEFDTRLYMAEVSVLKNEELFGAYMDRVPDERREHVLKCRFLKDRILALGAGLLLENALYDMERMYNARRSLMTVCENQIGKPSIHGVDGLFFNLSHSGTYAICALSCCEIGCDIQQMKDFDIRIAERFFSKEELGYILSAGREEEQKIRFYRIWTLKESYVKAKGKGMGISFPDFTVRTTKRGCAERQVIHGETLFFREYPAPEGYQIACCSERDNYEDHIRVVRLKDIL